MMNARPTGRESAIASQALQEEWQKKECGIASKKWFFHITSLISAKVARMTDATPTGQGSVFTIQMLQEVWPSKESGITIKK